MIRRATWSIGSPWPKAYARSRSSASATLRLSEKGYRGAVLEAGPQR